MKYWRMKKILLIMQKKRRKGINGSKTKIIGQNRYYIGN